MDPTNALNTEDAPTSPAPAQPPSTAPQPTGSAPPETVVHHPLVSTGGEQCPSCGATVAPDQRYCLTCGQRCGEPRLPFMNAVTFMDAMKRPAAPLPPSPKSKRRRLSANAALITGVGTLLLAMGVGVLIGRSGERSVATDAAAPQVITVGAGGAAAETESGASAGAKAASGGKGGKKTKAIKKKEAAAKKAAESGKGAEEVLKPANGVKLPPATVKPGGKCESGTAGCEGGKFTGNFFGE